MPQEIALVISKGFATLHELQTVYSWDDVLDMAEIAVIDSYNEWCAYNSDDKK